MKDLIVKPNITIRDAMKVLEKTAEKCLIVVDVHDNHKLLGTVTDGDLRRSILKGAKINSTIENSFNQKPITVQEGSYTDKEVGELLVQHKIDLIPVLDDQKRVVNYITWKQVFGDSKTLKKKTLTAPVVIMAGGRGTRLEPFTKVLPKPLVPIHDKPIIEHIIERFTSVGINDFFFMVNYKNRILKAFFEELNPDYSLSFIEEQEPLGTAGSLQFLTGKFKEPFLVTNCDIIIDADYIDLYAFHLNNGYDITLVASAKEYIIPYGACELNGDGHLDHIREKPSYNILANTGLYILNPETLKMIPKDRMYHITELIADAKKRGMKVGVYPISEDAWIDVGQWAEYQKAVERFGR
jgi:dTDP-glucose pyrophosphorylase